ncbi:MAG: HDOD domain-containing protein [Betaproteobacteria bacterium]|nr:HDOD domain-containing protein [Betaproteobacteria bacterium]
MHSAQELATYIESLAALPSVYYQVCKQLEAPDGSIAEVARLVETDPALTTGILKLVNSTFYGFSRKIESVERAIIVLGLRQTHELVLAITVTSVFEGIRPQYMDMKRYWIGCMVTALTTRELAHLTCNPAAGRLFVIGLLADIGHLVMYQTVPKLAIEAQTIANISNEPLFEAERRIVGCDSAEVGAALMDNWKLPPNFAEIIGAQITPRLAGRYVTEAELLHIALAVSKADRYNEPSEQALGRIDPRIWDHLDLDPESFSRIREAVEMNLSSCTAVFFPRAA